MGCPEHKFHVNQFGYIMLNNIQIDSTMACKLLEDGRIQMSNQEQKLASLEDIDDIAGTYKKIAKDQQELLSAIYQELASAECETIGDHSPFFKAKIELINDRIGEIV